MKRAPFVSRNLIVILLIIGMALLLWLYTAIIRHGEENILFLSNSLLLSMISIANFILFVIVAFVLLRDMIKAYLEIRHSETKTTYRTKLIFAFLIIGIIPSIILFFGAIYMVENTVSNWFHSPIGNSVEHSEKLLSEITELWKKEADRSLNEMVKIYKIDGESAITADVLKESGVEIFELINRSGKVIFMNRTDEKKGYIEFPPDKLSELFSGGESRWVIRNDDMVIISSKTISENSAIVIGKILPPEIFKNAESIAAANRDYLQLRSQQKMIKFSLIAPFLFLVLLVAFSSLWLGRTLAKGLMVPIGHLVEGTTRIASGDLATKIQPSQDDEFGTLIEAFNKMTEDLRVSREKLEKAIVALDAESKSAEQRLRYIETLLESLDVGVISIDLQGRIKTINRNGAAILGIKQKPIEGENVEDIFSKEIWSPIIEILKCTKGDVRLEREIEIDTEKGKQTLSATSSPLRESDGSLFGRILLFRDITDILRNQRIAAWQEVAQRLAHEIKNPLTPIRLSAGRMAKKAIENCQDLKDSVIEGAKTIEKEVSEMMSMVDAFSRFARFPQLNMEPVNIYEIVSGVISLYKETYTNVDFRMYSVNKSFKIIGDEDGLRRVMKNLMENSIEAMDSKGIIEINIKIEENKIVLGISDNGIGVSGEIRANIFQPYVSRKGRGRGLGLAIVKSVIEEHKGTISIEENNKAGAFFKITFPVYNDMS